ncbi:hypothetical protein CQW23_35491 [Capsicum baccatum]|uniref:Uncharacterized protein n=1 Tax=Capsicum baccatum TaxID=33114 RepID=A0A2G2UVU6_CAPBA|nr:hypothetical protein CQW23_35491 [Capsicum baccatum]
MDKRKFLWFSLEKKSLKHAKVSGGLDTFDSFVTLGTLVPLYYGGGDEKDGKKGVEERDDSGGVLFSLQRDEEYREDPSVYL